MTDLPARKTPRRSHLLALEPRMMFDAAAAVTLQNAVADHDAATHATPFADTHHAALAAADAPAGDTTRDTQRIAERGAPDTTPTASPHDVIFIDTSVDDYRQLASEWAGRGQIVLIDGTKDGIAQIQAALAGQSGISAIHIVSHGEEGAFFLGTTRVDSAAISGTLSGALGRIGQSLAPGGDILIYGCDFAAGADGAQALAAFADATHADVAASTDTTGAARAGGDWVLESHKGAIQARSLDGGEWAHTLNPNTPVPISVTADSLTVTDGSGNVVVSGTTGYGSDARSPDVGVGAVAVWAGAATYQGQSIDLRATVVSISSGDAIRFNRPTGTGANGDDPTFLLRDLTAANDATVQIRWDLVLSGTNTALPADVRFTILDIDGIGGNPDTRESVTAATTGLAYYTRENVSDINFVSSLDAITASGTQNENTVAGQPLTSKSAATFDWSKVSSFTLTYKLTTNTVTTQAQFYHDGDADFGYTDPVYVSIPRLDLDGDDSTASGNDAHFTFTENGPGVPIADSDLVVSNPMDINSITGGTVRLTNYQSGDTFTVGALPSNITASVGTASGGALTVTLSGTGSESDYAAAFRAISFANTSDTPSTVQRVIDVSFSNDTLTSAVATSRIDVVPVNDPPTAHDDTATTPEDTAVTIAVLANDTDPEGDPLTVTSASAMHGTVVRNADNTLTYTPNANYNGTDTISYAISDGNGGTSSAVVAVTITPVNDAPTPVGSLPARNAADAASVSYATAGGFTDVDGDTLTYSATGLPTGLTIDAASGVISGTIDRSASQSGGGRYAVVVTARDPSNASATQGFTIIVTNPAPTARDDTATTNEDTPVTIVVLANDSDPDGDPLTVTGASASHGAVMINADGTLRYAPTTNYNGTDTITYAISDGQGGTSTAHVAVTITPVNDAPTPVGTLPARATTDAATVSYPTASGFTDVDGDTLTYSANGLPAGLTIDAASGVISGTVDRSASQIGGGRYSVTVAARDPSGASANQTFTITVTNPAPTARDDTAATNEDTPVTITVLANDSDPDGDPLTVTGASALHGGVAVNPDNSLRYTPAANYNGADTITYTISDGQGGTATAHVAVTVTPVNDAPTAIGTLPPRSAADAASVSYATAAAFGDVDGDTLSYAASGLPTGLTIDAVSGVISGTIDRSASQIGGGVYTVAVAARDPSGASATQAFALTVTNPAPIAVADNARTHVDTPVTIAVLANDSDPDGDPITVTSASAGHGSVTINPDGTLAYAPGTGFAGRDTVTYTISDGQGGTASAIVTIDVTNAAPIADPLAPIAAQDGQAISLPLTPSFHDADGDPLRFTATGLPPGLTIDPATGVVSGTIDRSASQAPGGGYDSVITADDGHGGTVSANLRWSVANPAPTPADDVASVPEDGSIVIPVLANDSDPDGDPLTVTGASASHGAVTINPDGTLTYTPVRDYAGPDTITYTVDDGQGGTGIAHVSVTVSPIDDAPVAADDSARTHVDTPVTIPVLANDRDPDGDPLTVVSASAGRGSVTINPDGKLVYAPAAGFTGRDSITYTISDGRGGTASATVTIDVGNAAPTADPFATVAANDGAAVSVPVAGNFHDADGDPLTFSATGLPPGLTIDPATGVISGTIDRSASQTGGGAYPSVITADDAHGGAVSVTLPWSVANPAPIARDDTATTREDTAVIIPVLANDRDPDGDPLGVVAASAGHGGVSINPDGSIVYRPDADFNGTDQIRYTISDGQGGQATGTVTVVVTPVDDAPRAVGTLPALATADAASVTYPTASAFTDLDGDPLTYTATGLPVGLSIDPATGVIAGTLDRSASQIGGGAYSVTVTARDPSGETAAQTLAITIANPAPIAADDTATTAEDTPVTIPVLSNDRDPDGDPLTVTGATAAHGTVAVNGDGTLVYTPDADFNGSDTIAYAISDGQGGSAEAHVAVTVTPRNDAPVAVGTLPPRVAQDGAPVSYPTAASFADRDGDPLRYTASGLPAGLTIDPTTGVISGMIDRSASQAGGGVYNIVVTAHDPSNAFAEQRFGLTVANGAPLAIDDVVATVQDRAVTVPVLANDSDPNGDPLAVTGATAAHGTVAVNPDGTLLYTPAAGYVGADVIAYSVSDGKGGTAGARVGVTIAPVNAAPVATGTLPSRDTMDAAHVAYETAGGFTDPDGDVLRYLATGLPQGLSIDAASGVISGTLDRSASQIGGGSYTAIVTARDAGGGAAVQRFVIDVHNPAPIARDDATRTTQGASVTISVLANDSDPDGDPLTVTSASAAHGTATIAADGTVRYVAAQGFVGTDTIHYTISDGQGGTSAANVSVIVDPVNRAPVASGIAAVTVRGTEATIDVRPALSDPDGDPVRVTAATSPVGSVTVNADGTLRYVPPVGFVGATVIDYTVSDGRGGTAAGTVIVRVRPDPVDIGGLLRIGQVRFENHPVQRAEATLDADRIDAAARHPLILLDTVETIRSLDTTTIGDQAVADAVEAIDPLRSTAIDAHAPIATEVARLDAIRDQRDAGDRLFDHRWGDFMVKGFSGFSHAADHKACVMVESVVRGGAIYVEMRDTAEGGRAAFRKVDLGMEGGGRLPDWIRVDPRGLAIIERSADVDELHLIVRVTRTDGSISSTPIVIQGATGEVELDRHHAPLRRHAAPLDATLRTPSAALHAEALRLARHFQ